MSDRAVDNKLLDFFLYSRESPKFSFGYRSD